VRPKILVIKGDGIGPAVVSSALTILTELGFDAEFVFADAGLDYYRRTGRPFQPDLLDLARSVDAVYKGPIDTPKASGYRSITVMLRKELDLYANIRPFRSYPRISLREIDVVIVRENTEGLYVEAETMLGRGQAVALRLASRRAARRVAEAAFNLAIQWGRRRVTLIHKASILKLTDGLYLEEFYNVAKRFEGRIEADDAFVDAAGYFLVKYPERLDVLLTPNLYGDILSDVAAGVAGSMGLYGSANIGDRHAMFEPIHGTARDIAGKGIANPTAAIHAAVLMLRWLTERGVCGRRCIEIAEAVEKAVQEVIREGKHLTPDLGGSATTSEYTAAVLEKASAILEDGGGEEA